MSYVLLVAALLALPAEPPAPPSAPPAPPPQVRMPRPFQAEGKVALVAGIGEAPLVLKLDDGKGVPLVARGESDGELHRLAGVRVRVRGLQNEPTLPNADAVLVEHYQILDVGAGVAPRIGTLARLAAAGGDRLIFVDDQGNAEMLPASWMKTMAQQVGARLWMTGVRTNAGFAPGRFAIIRPPPASAPTPGP